MADSTAANQGIIPSHNMMTSGMAKAAKRIKLNQTHVDFFTAQV